MKKIILIGGTSRSGKSLLRNFILKRKQISGLSTDTLRAMIQHGSNLDGISQKNDPDENLVYMKNYLKAFIRDLAKFTNSSFVLEGDLLLPSLLKDYVHNEKFLTLYVAYPKINITTKIKTIREYEKQGDWTLELSDNELNEFVEEEVEKGVKYSRECKKLGIRFVDTSENFKGTISKIENEIIRNL